MNEMKLDGCIECPSCNNVSLPKISKNSLAFESVCQNPKCRMIVDKDGIIVKRMPLNEFKSKI
jgi:hypothetical protein